MLLRRIPSTVSVLAGLAAGGALLAAATVLPTSSADPTSPAPSSDPIEFRAASHDDAVDDVSGPCDEAEHAGDPRCAGTTVPTAAPAAPAVPQSSPTTSVTTPRPAPTSTSAPAPPAPPRPAAATTRTLDAAGAGTVRYTVSGTTFSLVSADPAAGWVVDVEQSGGIEIDLDFRSGTRRVQVDIEFEDGTVRERVRFRDDADGAETRTDDDH